MYWRPRYKTLLTSVTTNVNGYTELTEKYHYSGNEHLISERAQRSIMWLKQNEGKYNKFEPCGRCKESSVAVRRIIVVYLTNKET